MAYTVKLKLPSYLAKIFSPKSRPLFKSKPEVVQDKVFKARLQDNMVNWLLINSLGVPILKWWEGVVKPGIRKLAITRSKELNKERWSELNPLLLRQAYLKRKVHNGNMRNISKLKAIQL